MKLNKNLGMLLLGIWLILNGLSNFINIPIPSMENILSILAIAAGVFIIRK